MTDAAGFKPLGKILIERKLISAQQWEECLEQHRANGKSVGRVLVESGMLSQEKLLQTMAQQARIEVIDLDKAKIDKDALNKVAASMAQVYNIMPVKFEANTLTVAVSDPLNLQFLDDLRFTMGCNIQPVVAAEEQIQKKVNQYYNVQKESISALVGQFKKKPAPQDKTGKFKPEELQELAAQAPVVKLLNMIII
jgi:type IV pilus assembly protein PilB